MKSKIEKLQELQELLKAEAISQEEFETLKKEILEDKSPSKEEAEIPKEETHKEKTTEQKKGKKVILKGFHNAQNSRIEPPKITHIDFDDISDDEIKELKQFLRKKYADAPSEMTPDEIEIGNKLFSIREIDKINASRSGFNYAFVSIISLLTALFALYIMLYVPCLIFFGGVGGSLAVVIISIVILNKSDATKLDRYFSIASLLIIAFCVYLYNRDPFNGLLSDDSDDISQVENLVDCSQSSDIYNKGYSWGKNVLAVGGSHDCELFVQDMNQSVRGNQLSVSDCFCAGFDEAIALKEERYVSSNNDIKEKLQQSEEQGDYVNIEEESRAIEANSSNINVGATNYEIPKEAEWGKINTEPEFKGGTVKLTEFIAQNLNYPSYAIESGITGKVLLSFLVNKDGVIENIVVKSNTDEALNKEAIRIVKKMPKWTPGEIDGEKSSIQVTLPINFRLD
jgi:periplasmic protein TonB